MTGKILIIDDEKNIRRSVEMICSGEGYNVRTAADAEEALKALDGQPVEWRISRCDTKDIVYAIEVS